MNVSVGVCRGAISKSMVWEGSVDVAFATWTCVRVSFPKFSETHQGVAADRSTRFVRVSSYGRWTHLFELGL